MGGTEPEPAMRGTVRGPRRALHQTVKIAVGKGADEGGIARPVRRPYRRDAGLHVARTVLGRVSGVSVQGVASRPRRSERVAMDGLVAPVIAGRGRVVKFGAQPGFSRFPARVAKQGEKRADRLVPVPVMQGQVGVDLTQQGFEVVTKLAVPRQESRAAVDMCGLVDLIHLEPVRHTTSGKVGTAARKISVVELDNCGDEPLALRRRNGKNVSADAIACHGRLLAAPPRSVLYLQGAYLQGARIGKVNALLLSLPGTTTALA